MKLSRFCLSCALVLAPAIAVADAVPQSLVVPCADSPSMAAMLRKFHEGPLATAIDVSDLPLLLTVNPDTGTFSLLLQRPDGVTCILAAGKNFAIIGRPIAGTDL